MKKKKTSAKRTFGLQGFRGVKHCTKCREGRIIELKVPKTIIFCGFCGYEPLGKRA